MRIFPAEAGEFSSLGKLAGLPDCLLIIRAGRNINAVPHDLAKTMLANAGHGRGLDEDIEGEVEL